MIAGEETAITQNGGASSHPDKTALLHPMAPGENEAPQVSNNAPPITSTETTSKAKKRPSSSPTTRAILGLREASKGKDPSEPSPEPNSSQGQSQQSKPDGTLPGDVGTRVSVFQPRDPQAYKNVLKAKSFTRLRFRLAPAELRATVDKTSAVKETFCLCHQTILLVFSDGMEIHEDHVELVMKKMGENGGQFDVMGCVFHVKCAEEAGFKLQPMSENQIMVIDLTSWMSSDPRDMQGSV